ncbi:MAG: hypothetical protein ACTHXO_09500 [Actinomycetaceae bacterium]
MDRSRREQWDGGTSPATWAMAAALAFLVATYFLIGALPRTADIYWLPFEETMGLYSRVSEPLLFPAVALFMGTAITIAGLRVRTLLHGKGAQDFRADLAGAGGVLAGTSATVAAMAGLATGLGDHSDYLQDQAGLQAMIYLFAILLWFYPLTVGLGLITFAAVSLLQDKDHIGSVAAWFGWAAAIIALISPISLILGFGPLLTPIGQLATLAWLAIVPRTS